MGHFQSINLWPRISDSNPIGMFWDSSICDIIIANICQLRLSCRSVRIHPLGTMNVETNHYPLRVWAAEVLLDRKSALPSFTPWQSVQQLIKTLINGTREATVTSVTWGAFPAPFLWFPCRSFLMKKLFQAIKLCGCRAGTQTHNICRSAAKYWLPFML